MPYDENLVALVKEVVQVAVKEALAAARQPRVLSGSVEDVDSELGVLGVRMDSEAIAGDPMQSDNFEFPGVIPATRLGSTFTDDPAQVTFDAGAGAAAIQAGANNVIRFFGQDDTQTGQLDPDHWEIGALDPPGARLVLDPIAGIRIHDADNNVVVIFDPNGYTLRDGTSGQVLAEMAHGKMRLVDPTVGDHIELTTSSMSTLPNPNVRFTQEVTPGSSFVAPVSPVFTAPADDIEISHVVGWIAGVDQSVSLTPPGGETERQDVTVAGSTGTLTAGTATRDPASGAVGTWTSSAANWQHATGARVVIRGGGTTSPAYRSSAINSVVTSESEMVFAVPVPAGVVDGDALVAFVSVAAGGGSVPTTWETPPGVDFLGATFSTSGSGTGQSTVATGVWVKRAVAGEPSSFDVSIRLPSGQKVVHATTVAVSDPFLIAGGSQIRIAGHPIRRLLAFNELTAASNILCDFQNISQAYDNLTLLVDAKVDKNGATAIQRSHIQFNGDTGNNYFDRVWSSDGTNVQGFAVPDIRLGVMSIFTGNAHTATVDILGYARPGSQRTVMAQTFFINNLTVHTETIGGQWASTSPITRIQVGTQFFGGTQTQRFGVGSRVYLYGW